MIEHALRRHRVAHHDRLAGAHDAGFLKADAFPGVTQKFHVVQIDAGDDGAVGVQNVDGIEPTAQPDFQNHDIEFGIGQQLQNRQRGEFKVGQRDFIAILASCAFHTGEVSYQIRSTDDVAPNPAALFKMHQMRRGIDAGAVAGLHQNRLQHGAS